MTGVFITSVITLIMLFLIFQININFFIKYLLIAGSTSFLCSVQKSRQIFACQTNDKGYQYESIEPFLFTGKRKRDIIEARKASGGSKMYTERSGKQNKLEMVMLEELVPENHLLRKIDKAIDFSFINRICKPYYCENNGRPAIEPEVLFRMLFIGYLYGIRSETRLLQEIEVNVAYRWFIGYDLTA